MLSVTKNFRRYWIVENVQIWGRCLELKKLFWANYINVVVIIYFLWWFWGLKDVFAKNGLLSFEIHIVKSYVTPNQVKPLYNHRSVYDNAECYFSIRKFKIYTCFLRMFFNNFVLSILELLSFQYWWSLCAKRENSDKNWIKQNSKNY